MCVCVHTTNDLDLSTSITTLVGLSHWDNSRLPFRLMIINKYVAWLILLILVVGRKLKTKAHRSLPGFISGTFPHV